MAKSQKAQQEEKLAHPIREKVQEIERKLRKVEESKVVCVAKPQEA